MGANMAKIIITITIIRPTIDAPPAENLYQFLTIYSFRSGVIDCLLSRSCLTHSWV